MGPRYLFSLFLVLPLLATASLPGADECVPASEATADTPLESLCPVEEPPTEEPPVEEPPVEEPPVEEPPTEEKPELPPVERPPVLKPENPDAPTEKPPIDLPEDTPPLIDPAGSQNSGGISPDPSGGVSLPATPSDLGLASGISYSFLPETLSLRTIQQFDIPPFLLPIYQACGTEYRVPWQILASINRIETNFGRNLNTSYAGAKGWMQFMPSTWDMYGTDANRDGKKDPYNPVDAICSAARYLQAAGLEEDLRGAIWAYNHADWYVDDVLAGADRYYSMPLDFVAALSTLAAAPYTPAALEDARSVRQGGIPGMQFPRARQARFVTDGVVEDSGVSRQFGGYVLLRDSAGNRYLYGGLRGKLPARWQGKTAAKSDADSSPAAEAQQQSATAKKADKKSAAKKQVTKQQKSAAHRDHKNSSRPSRQFQQKPGRALAGESFARAKDLFFAVRPAGKSSPWIEPGPFVRGWRVLQESSWGDAQLSTDSSPAGALLLAGSDLSEAILKDPNLEISDCDRQYIRQGVIDRRILSLLAYLSAEGYRLGISSMLCGRETSITVSGNASYHSFGQAIDIATINGETVFGNQRPGSLTEAVVRRIMGMQGAMVPAELISLFDFGGPSWSDPVDHADHIHVGYGDGGAGSASLAEVIGANQWGDIVRRLQDIAIPSLEGTEQKALRGRVSYFGGTGEATASGISVRTPGVALNLDPGTDSGWNNPLTQKWITWAREGRPMMVLVRTQGKQAVLPVIDLGPAGWTDRAIDLTEAGVRRLGLTPSTFRTDAPGTAVFLGRAEKK